MPRVFRGSKKVKKKDAFIAGKRKKQKREKADAKETKISKCNTFWDFKPTNDGNIKMEHKATLDQNNEKVLCFMHKGKKHYVTSYSNSKESLENRFVEQVKKIKGVYEYKRGRPLKKKENDDSEEEWTPSETDCLD